MTALGDACRRQGIERVEQLQISPVSASATAHPTLPGSPRSGDDVGQGRSGAADQVGGTRLRKQRGLRGRRQKPYRHLPKARRTARRSETAVWKPSQQTRNFRGQYAGRLSSSQPPVCRRPTVAGITHPTTRPARGSRSKRPRPWERSGPPMRGRADWRGHARRRPVCARHEIPAPPAPCGPRYRWPGRARNADRHHAHDVLQRCQRWNCARLSDPMSQTKRTPDSARSAPPPSRRYSGCPEGPRYP